jgi:hypothetical protein
MVSIAQDFNFLIYTERVRYKLHWRNLFTGSSISGGAAGIVYSFQFFGINYLFPGGSYQSIPSDISFAKTMEMDLCCTSALIE